ncbi:hypothetical protein QVD17_04101 [Tagetes erecta]|uniref:Uncharacterized protein n=1 Tax=Tagetes erecta TaxID=13708 RepID=A0AAD8LCJ2_TARER|nr:hypothetical protein QVD17_04101 [Tagetes erecta]
MKYAIVDENADISPPYKSPHQQYTTQLPIIASLFALVIIPCDNAPVTATNKPPLSRGTSNTTVEGNFSSMVNRYWN